jgi:hypothetical protein
MQGSRFLSLALGLTSLLSAAALAQAPPPTIASIDPLTAPTSGSVKVTLTGDNLDLPPNFACILPCPTRVFFGGAEASVRESSNKQVVVLAPPHPAGTVDVTLTTGDARTTTAAKAFTYLAAPESGWQMLLLPIYLDAEIPGAYGSRWKTDLWTRNNGTAAAALAPWVCPDGFACPAIFPLTYSLQPGESLHNLPVPRRPAGSPPARLLYINRTSAEEVSLNLRVFDLSRATLNGGTELPLVREDDFRTTTANLLNVPLDTRFRKMLRIYEMRAAGEAFPMSTFRVRIYDQVEGTKATLLSETTVTALSTQSGSFRDAPAYGQIADLTEGISAVGDQPGSLRVQVEPLTEGSRYWAMVSVTNLDTQQITIISPQ